MSMTTANSGTLPPARPPVMQWCDPLMLEFVMGMAVGVVWRRGLPLGWSWLALSLAGLLIAWLLGLDPWIARLHGVRLMEAVTFLAPLFGVLWWEKHREPGPRLAWLRLIGDASYAIYLFQFFVVMIAACIRRALHLPAIVTPPGTATR